MQLIKINLWWFAKSFTHIFEKGFWASCSFAELLFLTWLWPLTRHTCESAFRNSTCENYGSKARSRLQKSFGAASEPMLGVKSKQHEHQTKHIINPLTTDSRKHTTNARSRLLIHPQYQTPPLTHSYTIASTNSILCTSHYLPSWWTHPRKHQPHRPHQSEPPPTTGANWPLPTSCAHGKIDWTPLETVLPMPDPQFTPITNYTTALLRTQYR